MRRRRKRGKKSNSFSPRHQRIAKKIPVWESGAEFYAKLPLDVYIEDMFYDLLDVSIEESGLGEPEDAFNHFFETARTLIQQNRFQEVVTMQAIVEHHWEEFKELHRRAYWRAVEEQNPLGRNVESTPELELKADAGASLMMAQIGLRLAIAMFALGVKDLASELRSKFEDAIHEINMSNLFGH